MLQSEKLLFFPKIQNHFGVCSLLILLNDKSTVSFEDWKYNDGWITGLLLYNDGNFEANLGSHIYKKEIISNAKVRVAGRLSVSKKMTGGKCKYHIIWYPKYRRKKLYGKIRRRLGEIIHELCR